MFNPLLSLHPHASCCWNRGSIRDTGLNKDMSIKSKIESAKTDKWITEGLTDEEIEEAIQSAKSETIVFQYVEDTDLAPTQKEALDSLLLN